MKLNSRSFWPPPLGRTLAACLVSGLLFLGCNASEEAPPGGAGGRPATGGTTGGQSGGTGGSTAQGGSSGGQGGAGGGGSGTGGRGGSGAGGTGTGGTGAGGTGGSGGSGGSGGGSVAGTSGCRDGSGCRGGSSGGSSGGSGGSASDGGGTRDRTGAADSGGMSNDLPAMCARYCDCMSNNGQNECKSRTPANCMNTCMQQGRNWDLSCRIDKCVKAKTDYKDQIVGDCKAAIGDQACFDIE